MQTDIPTAINDVLTLRTFTPNPHVNKVMTTLVDSIVYDTATIFSSIDPLIQSNIRKICSDAETEMEKFWAQHIITSPDPQMALQAFPYMDNYIELTQRELHLVSKSGLVLDRSHSVLMIGSGPLPLSAFEIHRQSGARVDHVDSSLAAIDLCRGVSSRLGLDSTYHHALGHEVVLDKQYDLVLVAALAGVSTEDKQHIIDNILPSLAAGGRIIVRSAAGNRQLLYSSIDAQKLKGVRLLQEYHPTDHIINSVLIYERNT